MSDNNNTTKTTKLLAKSIKNLRENLTELSLDSFLKNTLETVMQIEREEYLENLRKQTILNSNLKKDKSNGFYGRAFNNL